MTDGCDGETTASWIDDRSRLSDGVPETSRLEVIPDTESDTVTIAPADSDRDDTTTAWISADAPLVVDVEEMR